MVFKTLSDCIAKLFGITALSFQPSTPGGTGRFEGFGFNATLGIDEVFPVVNDAHTYNSFQISAEIKKLGGELLQPGNFHTGMAPTENPFLNFTNNNNTAVGTLVTQVHELGHSLAQITTNQPDVEGKTADHGKALEDCVRKNGGIR